MQLTAEAIITAAAEAGSLTKLGYKLGFAGKIGGGTIKKIKELVPDIMERLGKTTPMTVVSQPVSEVIVSARKVEVLVANPYHVADLPAKSFAAELFDLASVSEMDKGEFVQMVVAKTGRSVDTVEAFLDVLSDPANGNNLRRSRNVAPAGRVLIATA